MGSVIENAVSVRPYWTLLSWFCALCSPDILKQASFYNPSPPSSVGFPEFCLMLDCGSLPTGLLLVYYDFWFWILMFVCVWCVFVYISYALSQFLFLLFLSLLILLSLCLFYLSICFLRRWRRYRTYVWGSQGNFGRDGVKKHCMKIMSYSRKIYN